MFEHKKIAESKHKDQTLAQTQSVQDFLQLWQAMKLETKDRIRLIKLEIRVDKTWRALSQEQRDAVWMIIRPQDRPIKETFDASALKIR